MSRLLALVLPLVALLGACSDAEGEAVSNDAATLVLEDQAPLCRSGEVDGNLNLYAQEGLLSPDLIATFASEFGVEVVADAYDPGSDLLGKLQSGAVYDVVTAPGALVSELVRKSLITEIQTSAVPNMRGIGSLFRDPPYGSGGGHSIAFLWGTYGLGINGGVADPDESPSWGLVLDPASAALNSGSISLMDDARQALGAALLFLGYSANSADETELEAASRLLASVDDYVTYLPPGDLDGFRDGSILIAHGRSDLFRSTRAAEPEVEAPQDDEVPPEAPVGFLVPSEGAMVWTTTFVVPANAEHLCTALTFIDYALDPDSAAMTSNWANLATTVDGARATVDPSLLDDPAVYPPSIDGLEILGDVDSAEQYARQFTLARS